MIVLFAGTIGRSGLGGQAWASLQYLLGLRSLGHEVFYLEDCGESSWVYNWENCEWTTELDYPAAYVRACLEPLGFAGQWLYRTSEGSIGAPIEMLRDLCERAGLLIMRAVPLWVWRDEYDLPKRRAFIDVDPGFTQISIETDQGLAEGIARAEKRFTVGQRIGAADCPVPAPLGPWLPTLPPVVLEHWPRAESDATHFTSVIRWQGFRQAQHGRVVYGQRDQQFPKYLDLPSRVNQGFRIALLGTEPENLTRHGWEVAPGEIVSQTPASYRGFIQQSRGEFCVPKHGYVATRGGWFSDRSVCYLASGRPVLMEDTGIGEAVPLNDGVLLFRSPDEATEGIARINADYERHRRAARKLAEEIFAAEIVLPRLLEDAMS